MIEALRANSAGLAASLIVKASKGYLIAVHLINTNVGARFLQVFDSATLPADTTVPLISISVPAGGTFLLNFAPFGLLMQNGIAVCNSTTAATKTLGSADSFISAAFA